LLQYTQTHGVARCRSPRVVPVAVFRLLLIVVYPGRVHPGRRIGWSYLACEPFKAAYRGRLGSPGEEHSMITLREMTDAALRDFANVSALTGAECDVDRAKIEALNKPHKPSGLPTGRMAVYCFFFNGQALKIGIAGPNSDARYRSQHYNPNSAGSNLAKSILAYPSKIGIAPLHISFVGNWIKEHTDRINILLPSSYGKPMLSMLETFLHARWKPAYEGREAREIGTARSPYSK